MQKINKDNKFKIHANCFIVKGYTRSIIYDLQRKEYSFLPNDLEDILSSYTNHTINDILLEFSIKTKPLWTGSP